LEHTHSALGIHIDPDTAATRWRGERMDYDLGVWVLSQQAAVSTDNPADVSTDDSADVSAETFEAEQDVEHDGEWWRHDEGGPAYLTPHSRATDAVPTSQEP
jgi:hypothetical protein